MDPPVAPKVRGPSCPMAPPHDHWYGGLGVSLGDSEAWKSQNLGVAGGLGALGIGIVATNPRYGQFLVLGLFDTSSAYSGPFLAIFGPSLGHILEVEGNKGLFVTRKSRRTCSVVTVCLLLAIFSGFWGRFGAKRADLGHKMSNFGRAPPDLAPVPQGATGEFLAQNLDSARAPPSL